MLHVILLILKILGIILLAVVGLVLFAVYAVFFMALPYRIEIKKKEEIQISAFVSWFFRIVTVRFRLDSADGWEPEFQMRLFGYPLWQNIEEESRWKRLRRFRKWMKKKFMSRWRREAPPGREKQKDYEDKTFNKEKKQVMEKFPATSLRESVQEETGPSAKREGTVQNETGPSAKQEGTVQNETDPSAKREGTAQNETGPSSGHGEKITDAVSDLERKDAEADREEMKKTSSRDENNRRAPADPGFNHREEKTRTSRTGNEKRAGKKSAFQKLCGALRGVYDKIIQIWKKITGIGGVIRKLQGRKNALVDLWNREESRQARETIWKEFRYLWKKSGPKKIRGKIRFGFADPTETGLCMGAAGMLCAWYPKKLEIVPDFDREILEGNVLIKGKARIYVFVRVLWRVYINEDIRKMYRYLRE